MKSDIGGVVLSGFVGNPLKQAAILRDLADRCEAGEIKFFTVVTLEHDGSTGFCHCGKSSFIEHIGLLDMAKDTAYAKARE